ncbi:MAG TPA: hypothetical protein VLK65_06080 [Vicinamibacteria bacterium]|nr:hypothetical protein [Vicinamibacteria bacterium]
MLSEAFLGALLLNPSFHFVLSDGSRQLLGLSEEVAERVAGIFADMEVDVSWSFDASELPSLPPRTVHVIVRPHSARDWGLSSGVLATVLREPDSRSSVFVFYPDLERALIRRPMRPQSLRGGRPPGEAWLDAVSGVITHEILHYFLPGRSHDRSGVFAEHVDGGELARSSFETSPETRDALIERLRPDLDPSAAGPER